MTKVPQWLASSAIQELLHTLVDRLDSAEVRGSGKAQTIALSEGTWPALYASPYESDKEILWEQVRELAQMGLIAVTPEKAVRSPAGYDMGVRLSVASVDAVRQATGRLAREKSAAERWKDAVATWLEADESAKKTVAGYCIDLPGYQPGEVVQKLNGLTSLAEEPLLLREVSAKLFWGMSKVLDHRQAIVAAVLGVPECPFPEAPVQLQVHLPAGSLQGVLFIENAMSYEKATRSNSPLYNGLALIYASGFKASARRLRSPEGASLYYARNGSLGKEDIFGFESWLFSNEGPTPAHFWGDLDWSGMRILQTLRSTFGDVQAWVPGYEPMLNHLEAGQGHEPEAAEKRRQLPVTATGCSYADAVLIPKLAQLGAFVDQELFNV